MRPLNLCDRCAVKALIESPEPSIEAQDWLYGDGDVPAGYEEYAKELEDN